MRFLFSPTQLQHLPFNQLSHKIKWCPPESQILNHSVYLSKPAHRHLIQPSEYVNGKKKKTDTQKKCGHLGWLSVFDWPLLPSGWKSTSGRWLFTSQSVLLPCFAAFAAAGGGHNVDSWVHHRPGCRGWNRDFFFFRTLSPLGKRVAELTWISATVALSVLRFFLRKPEKKTFLLRFKKQDALGWIGRGSAPNATDFSLSIR